MSKYTQTVSIRLRHFTIRLDSHGVASRANRLPAWRIDNRGNDSCPIVSTHPAWSTGSQIREIMIHEPSSFLKRGHKLQSIRTIRVDAIESTRIDNNFSPPSKSRSTTGIFFKSRTNRLPACWIDRRGNDSCRLDGIGFTNQFPVCWIANTKDESTLVGCIGDLLSKTENLSPRVNLKSYMYANKV